MERPMGRNRKMVNKRRIGAMYVKRAMREIASCLAMTAGGCCNQKHSSSPDCLIENFLTLAMTVEAGDYCKQRHLTFNS